MATRRSFARRAPPAVTLLLGVGELEKRRTEIGGSLAPLADSLRADLEPLLQAVAELPTAKALLSRDGGRCPRDGGPLDFDPYSPHEHRCPRCGEVTTGEMHDRWWITWFHLWLAERAVHAAALHALRAEATLSTLALQILSAYAERYLQWPNRDNVLGPSRPFFSTYLESIWLLQLCVATDLLERAEGPSSTGLSLRDRLIEPSTSLIASFNEGMSNRQVWNNAALLAAARLLGDDAMFERAVFGEAGLMAHLAGALLSDGTWYEGENYHLFAHRGLWYAVRMAEVAGANLPLALADRFQEGFATPLATALPDFTFPSRRDSQYAISLRQWRFAESCELGVARHSDARLLGAIGELYRPELPCGDSGRWRSTAEAERNEPATGLSRRDLNWRALLLALPALPPFPRLEVRSALLEGQGMGVLRRHGEAYVALDYGHSGGGHGHADRLNVLLAHGHKRWLDDMGTGSYVDSSLHWYRSTLAHNAPLFGGESQRRADGVLRAWDDRGGIGWIDAEVPRDAIAPGVRAWRAVVVMSDYAIDRLEWESEGPAQLDLPIHIDAEVAEQGWKAARMEGGRAPEDGFAWLHDAAVAPLRGREAVRLAVRGTESGLAWVIADDDAELWRVRAPAAPGSGGGEREFYVVRSHSRRGVVISVWSWAGAVVGVTMRDDTLVVDTGEGERHEHGRSGREWRVVMGVGGARSSIELAGVRAEPHAALVTATPSLSPRATALPLVSARPRNAVVIPSTDAAMTGAIRIQLGVEAYRRSEVSWTAAGGPTAEILLASGSDAELRIAVMIRKRDFYFRPATAPDHALDNEHPDIHSDGVQLYLLAPSWPNMAGWLAVPDPASGGLRMREIAGTRGGVRISGIWRPSPEGYEISFAIPLDELGDGSELPFMLDVIVNDMSSERTRRRGQLVMSGGGGFTYLQGDRQSSDRLLPFVVYRD